MATGCFFNHEKPDDKNSEDKLHGELQSSIHRGILTPGATQDIASPLLAEVWDLLDEGTRVKPGDVICVLSEGDRKTKLKEAQSDCQMAHIKFEMETELLPVELELARLYIEKAGLEFKKKEEEYEKYYETRDWLKIFENVQNSGLKKFEKTVIERRIDAERKLQEEGFSAKLNLIDSEKELRLNDLEAKFTERYVPWLREKADEKALFKAEIELACASESLFLARMTLENLSQISEIKLEMHRLEIARRKKKVEKYESEIASLTIRAPVAGIVVRKNIFNGSSWEKLSQGDKVFPRMNFLAIQNCENFGVNFVIDQSCFPNVKAGNRFLFRPDTSPEYLLPGIATESPLIAIEIETANPYGERGTTIKGLLASAPLHLIPGLTGTIELIPNDSSPTNHNHFKTNGRHVIAQKKPMKRSLTVPGNIIASKRSLVSPPFSGNLAWIEEDSKTIKTGDVIARLDCSEIRKNLDELIGKLKNKTEQLDLEREKAEIGLAQADRKVQIAYGAFLVAELEHRMLIKRRDENEIINLQKSKELIESNIRLLKETLKLEEDLEKRGLKSDLDVMKTRLEIAVKEREQSINDYKLELELSGPTKRQLRLSKIALETARVDWEIAKASKIKEEKNMQFNRRILETEIELLSIKKNEESDKELKAEVKSPRDGAVILPEVYKQGQISKVKTGDKLNSWIPFMHVAELSSLEVKLEVSEMDSKFIKQGKPVEIILKSAPGKTFTGWVDKVGLVASSNLAERQDAVTEVIITLVNQAAGVMEIDPAFRPGATCEVNLVLYDLPEAIVLSYHDVIPGAQGPMISIAGKIKPLKIDFSDGLNGYVISAETAADLDIVVTERGQ